MAVSAVSPTVSDVKGKLQGVLAELEKYKDLYRTTNQELEIEKDKRTKVLAVLSLCQLYLSMPCYDVAGERSGLKPGPARENAAE